MNVCESLTVTTRLFPDRVAIVHDGREISYTQLNALSVAAADVLLELGIKTGDRVALMLPNSPAFPIWYYAALRIGAIAVSVSTRLAFSEVDFVISDCGAKVLVASQSATGSSSFSDDTIKSCHQVIVDDASGRSTEPDLPEASWDATNSGNEWISLKPDDPALILYTSGTTGFPKGATLSHNNVRSNVHAFNHLCNMRPDDRVLLAVPLFHCFGQNALLNSVLNVGGTIILQQRFDLNESKRLITDNQVTQLYGVPMMFSLFLDSCSTDDLASVNYCFSAAATLPIQVSKRWQETFGLPIFEGYGLTETSPFATYNHRIKFLSGSIGMPIDSVEIKIVDTETNEVCPPGVLGEIAIRGPNVMLGYWNRPEETKQAIRDGWFHSGDIGRLDESGYLYIVDRVKDMITIGGLKVFPAEVERVLLDHPAVSEAAVIGIPDSVFGEQVVSFLTPANDNISGESLASIQQHAKNHLGNYKLPKSFWVVDELPRNPSGKVLKTRLREMAATRGQEAIQTMTNDTSQTADGDAPLAPTTSSFREPTLAAQIQSCHRSERHRTAILFLQQLIQDICETDDLPDPGTSLIESELDSLAIVEMSSQLQIEVGERCSLPPTLLFDYPRIDELAKFLVDTLTPEAQENQSMPAKHSNDKSKLGDHPTVDQQLDQLKAEIEELSESEALEALMKELQ
ncbi:MAG: AMP-binding protein [Planctomycetota bacterium]